MRRAAGFTLMEVLVALTVLGVALAALIKVGSETARNAAYLRDRTYAHWVAMNVLAEARAGLLPLRAGVRRGSEELLGREWFWSLEMRQVRPSVLGQRLQALWRLQIGVYDAPAAQGRPLLRLEGYLPP